MITTETIFLGEIHSLWQPFFSENKDEICRIFASVTDKNCVVKLCPSPDRIFRFASFDASKLQIVVLGQDPYPQPNVATGRSFEVGGLTDWTTPFRQTSLRNILRAIYKAKTGEDIIWTKLRSKIKDGSFEILPPDSLFDSLEKQGVLFLNTYLTCTAYSPLSHASLWHSLSKRLIEYIDTRLPNRKETAWFLWGNHARSYSPLISNGIRYESRHPMMCGNYPDDFLKNPCFQLTADRVDWTGCRIQNI